MTLAESLPLFPIGVLVSIAVGVVINGRVAATLGMSRLGATAGIVGFGVIISATLTPLRQAVGQGASGGRSCDMSRVGLASLDELAAVSVNDVLLNVLLFIPFGLAIGLAPPSRRAAALVLAGVTLPFAIEMTQLLVIPLGRSCQSADVVDNLVGLTLGYTAGSVLARIRA